MSGSRALARLTRAVGNQLCRRRLFREWCVSGVQSHWLSAYPRTARRLIVFLVPGDDGVTGGILSIVATFHETLRLRKVHGAEAMLCTIPGDLPLLYYTRFENQDRLHAFSAVLAYFPHLERLLVHIPEYCVGDFLQHCGQQDRERLRGIAVVQFNLMIQNIDLLAPDADIQRLKQWGRVTCTTAHEAYTTGLANRLGCPVHLLSDYVSPEQYKRVSYEDKGDLMVVSPDPHRYKARIIEAIAWALPWLRVRVVRDITYERYKQLIAGAKWALTFGEGLDGYFVETVFSGGISFAVYNSRFFTDDFRALSTVYPSYEALEQRICTDLKTLDQEDTYRAYQEAQHDVCARHYHYRQYVEKLTGFYATYFA